MKSDYIFGSKFGEGVSSYVFDCKNCVTKTTNLVAKKVYGCHTENEFITPIFHEIFFTSLNREHLIQRTDFYFDKEEDSFNLILPKGKSVERTLYSLFPSKQDRDWFIVCQCLQILDDLNSLGLAHFDIKRDNMVILNNKIVLIDGGMCTKTHVIPNNYEQTYTRWYRAPETLQNSFSFRKKCYSSDIWAMGCVMYELIEKKILYQADSDDAVSWFHDSVVVNFSNSTDQKVKNIILACLSKNNEDRPHISQLLKMANLVSENMSYKDTIKTQFFNSRLQHSPLKNQSHITSDIRANILQATPCHFLPREFFMNVDLFDRVLYRTQNLTMKEAEQYFSAVCFIVENANYPHTDNLSINSKAFEVCELLQNEFFVPVICDIVCFDHLQDIIPTIFKENFSTFDFKKIIEDREKVCYNECDECEKIKNIHYTPDDKYIECEYLNGRKHGNFRKWNNDEKNQLIIKCTYFDGKLNGKFEEWYDQGGFSAMGEYLNGKKHGIQKEWYSQQDGGNLALEEEFTHGKKHGIQKEWDSDGQLKLYSSYVNGKLDGKMGKFYSKEEGGGLSLETTYVNDERHGATKMWYSQEKGGKLKSEGIFVNDKLNGEYKEWDKDGQLLLECNRIGKKMYGTVKKWDGEKFCTHHVTHVT